MLAIELRVTLRYGISAFLLLFIPLVAEVLQYSFEPIFTLATVKAYPIFSTPPDYSLMLCMIVSGAGIILIAAGILSVSAFRKEYSDAAFEYLFTFPLSRSRIIRYKIIPRILFLFGLVIIYELLAIWFIFPLRSFSGPLFFLIDPIFFPAVVTFIFFGGFFLGIYEQKNWGAIISLVVLISLILTTMGLRSLLNPSGLFPGSAMILIGASFCLAALLILTALYLAAFSVFKQMDIRSIALFTRRFAMRVLLPLVFLSFASVAILLL